MPPIYDFHCAECGEEFEFFKYRSDEKASCPKCHEDDPKKLAMLPPKNVDYIPKGPNWMKKGRSGY